MGEADEGRREVAAGLDFPYGGSEVITIFVNAGNGAAKPSG